MRPRSLPPAAGFVLLLLLHGSGWAFPQIPDCSELGQPETLQYEQCFTDQLSIPMDVNPDEAVSVEFQVVKCSYCCPNGCNSPCTGGGTAISWDILDQNGHAISHDADIVDGTLSEIMLDRGSLGDCGNPTAFAITRLHSTNVFLALVNVTTVPRTGWNQAGLTPSTAPDIGPASSWCGSSNRWSECDPFHMWSVDLAPDDTLEVAARFEGVPAPGCSNIQLAVYDSALANVETLIWDNACGVEEKFATYVHASDPGRYYVMLGGVPGGGSDLLSYAISFAVTRPPSPVPALSGRALLFAVVLLVAAGAAVIARRLRAGMA